MKYFTKELWAAHNSGVDEERRRALEEGDRNALEYGRQLELLRSRLPPEAYSFFSGESLHDGRLVEFIAGDDVGRNVYGPEKFDINAHRTSVLMKVLGCNLDEFFTLKYTKVRRVVFDYPSADPLFHDEGEHIGDWGYDELTAADDSYLRHEILFASGTTILIEFKDFSYEKVSCEGTRYI